MDTILASIRTLEAPPETEEGHGRAVLALAGFVGEVWKEMSIDDEDEAATALFVAVSDFAPTVLRGMVCRQTDPCDDNAYYINGEGVIVFSAQHLIVRLLQGVLRDDPGRLHEMLFATPSWSRRFSSQMESFRRMLVMGEERGIIRDEVMRWGEAWNCLKVEGHGILDTTLLEFTPKNQRPYVRVVSRREVERVDEAPCLGTWLLWAGMFRKMLTGGDLHELEQEHPPIIVFGHVGPLVAEMEVMWGKVLARQSRDMGCSVVSMAGLFVDGTPKSTTMTDTLHSLMVTEGRPSTEFRGRVFVEEHTPVDEVDMAKLRHLAWVGGFIPLVLCEDDFVGMDSTKLVLPASMEAQQTLTLLMRNLVGDILHRGGDGPAILFAYGLLTRWKGWTHVTSAFGGASPAMDGVAAWLRSVAMHRVLDFDGLPRFARSVLPDVVRVMCLTTSGMVRWDVNEEGRPTLAGIHITSPPPPFC